jgi:hypothetical protein
MAIALLLALALVGAEPPAAGADAPPPASDQPVASAPEAPRNEPPAPPAVDKADALPTHQSLEDVIPDGAPTDDYEFVAWCHGALAGQVELDPIVEKDMDSIEGKEKAAKRKAGDAEIAKEHKRYLALYEKALLAAEKASPVAIHDKGVDAELQGYKIWGATRNKAPIWRMVDWGNWEVPPHCEKAAKRLYDRASLFGEALTTQASPTKAADASTTSAPAPDAPDPGKAATPAASNAKAGGDGLRGPQ